MPFRMTQHVIVDGFRASRTSLSTTTLSDFPTIKNTHVSIPTKALKSIASGSCALVTLKCRPKSRSVSGTPTLSGADSADDIPGIILYDTPAARSAEISSLTRANTDGHPPFNRATFFPRRASSQIKSQISLCRHDAQNGGTDGGAPPSFAAHALAIGLAGFFIAAPDGIYGGAAPRNLCDYAKRGGDAALAAAAAGFVNGCGSVGAIGQGFVTYKVVEVCGWEGLFASLAAAMAATAVAVRPALAVEEAAMGGAKASKRVKVA